MSQTISIPNYALRNRLFQAKLTQDIAAGLNSLPVDNSANFVTGGPVIIGDLGDNTAEMQTADTPASNTVIPLTANTLLSHNSGERVTLLFGDQLRIYRTNDVYGNGSQPPDGNFVLLAGGTVSIVASEANTLFTDSAGVSGQWYKWTYYNSTTFAETALADSRAVQAGVIHYASLDQIRAAAGFATNPNVTDAKISEFRDAAERIVNGALTAVYQFPLPQPTNPIVVQITKNIAAGNLKAEMFQNVSVQMAEAGEKMANKALHGYGDTMSPSLAELVDRSVVLEDANFAELTIDEGHGFGGYPDGSDNVTNSHPHFRVDKVY